MISIGNIIITARMLKKSCTVDAAKARLNSFPLFMCPTETIVFGDVNDKNSRIRKLLQVEKIDKATLKLKEERAYAVLDEIRVSPNVWYLRKIRNKKIA